VVPVSGFLTDADRDAVNDALGVENLEPGDEPAEALLAADPEPAKPRGRPRGSKTRKRRKPATTRKAPPRPPSRKTAIKAMLESAGGVWNISETLRGHDEPTCGAVLVMQADQIATNLNTLAQQDEGVARWLDAMMTGGGWGGVVLSTWPVVQAILAAHVMPTITRRREAAAAAAAEQEATWPPDVPTL
jgi:hypothetical protein